MTACRNPLQVTLVGGGMITHDLLLPAFYHLQRLGAVSGMEICALNSAPLRDLVQSTMLHGAFPGQGFKASPSLDEDPRKMFPDLYKDLIRRMPPWNLVVVAVPDQFHYPVIRAALEADQHVLSVKPLVLHYAESVEIDEMARARGLFVGVEYHKRFDRRNLEARALYHAGRFGEFRCGEAKLIEPWHYRHSNFQNWFTKENTDPFTYIGCHYVDLVCFITGLKPVELTLDGCEGRFPNGNVGYMWASGRVRYENGGLLSVINGLGYPDEGAGSNDQALCLFCEGPDKGGLLTHDDQFRGVQHGYVDKGGAPSFRFINPDFLRLVPWPGDGLRPVGYGYDSVEANVLSVVELMDQTRSLAGGQALAERRRLLEKIDEKGLIATPRNSFVNELVMEAGRLSILNGGRHVTITYGKTPGVSLK